VPPTARAEGADNARVADQGTNAGCSVYGVGGAGGVDLAFHSAAFAA